MRRLIKGDMGKQGVGGVISKNWRKRGLRKGRRGVVWPYLLGQTSSISTRLPQNLNFIVA